MTWFQFQLYWLLWYILIWLKLLNRCHANSCKGTAFMGSIHSCLMLLITVYSGLVSRPLTEFLEHGLVLDLDVRYHDTWDVLILQDTIVGAVFSR